MSNTNYDDLPYALKVWIAKEKAKDEAHKVAMIKRNVKESAIYRDYLVKLGEEYKSFTKPEKIIYHNMIRWYDTGNVFSVLQKGVITTLYLKYNK